MATLSQVLRGSFRMLGLGTTYLLSGGSATTAVVGSFANEETPPEDDYAVNWTLIVDEADAAAPEGEFANITDYNGGTYTFTCDTLTAVLASGDSILVCKPTIRLKDMIAAVNTALTEIDAVPLIDSSIALDGEAYEYSLPAGVLDVVSVAYIPTGGEMRIPVTPKLILPATVSAVAKLAFTGVLPEGTLYVTYKGAHSAVNAYNDTVSPTIPLQLIVAQTAHCALRNVSQQSPLWQEKYNVVIGELNAARQVKRQLRPMRHSSILDLQ